MKTKQTAPIDGDSAEWYGRWYSCSECLKGADGADLEHKIFYDFKHCPMCGVLIDWSKKQDRPIARLSTTTKYDVYLGDIKIMSNYSRKT